MFFGDNATLLEVYEHINKLSINKDFTAVNIERRRLVFKWLYLFKYSDRSTLMYLTNTNKDSGGYRFIASLIKQKYIHETKSPYYNKNIFTLNKRGIGELFDVGYLEDTVKLPNKKKIERSSRISHDIGVQNALILSLKNYYKYNGVVSIKREQKCGNLIADTILVLRDEETNGDLLKVAIEFERTDKSRQRVEYLLVQHMENIKSNKVDLVDFYFIDYKQYIYYQKILIDDPRVWELQEHGEYKKLKDHYCASRKLNNCLRFFYLENNDVSSSNSMEYTLKNKNTELHVYLKEKHLAGIAKENMELKVRKKEDHRKKEEEKRIQEMMEDIREEERAKLREVLIPSITKDVEKRLTRQFKEKYKKMSLVDRLFGEEE